DIKILRHTRAAVPLGTTDAGCRHPRRSTIHRRDSALHRIYPSGHAHAGRASGGGGNVLRTAEREWYLHGYLTPRRDPDDVSPAVLRRTLWHPATSRAGEWITRRGSLRRRHRRLDHHSNSNIDRGPCASGSCRQWRRSRHRSRIRWDSAGLSRPHLLSASSRVGGNRGPDPFYEACASLAGVDGRRHSCTVSGRDSRVPARVASNTAVSPVDPGIKCGTASYSWNREPAIGAGCARTV
ncbi:MAG: hypothetical protein AVDCRST_MAG26-1312, partial [uncultured Chloroflexia bacterium]